MVVDSYGHTHIVTVTSLKDACLEAEMDRFMTLISDEILPKGQAHAGLNIGADHAFSSPLSPQ